MRSFGDNIYTTKITINEAEMDQSNLVENVAKFNSRSRSRQEILMKMHMLFMKVESECFRKWNISKKSNARRRIENINF